MSRTIRKDKVQEGYEAYGEILKRKHPKRYKLYTQILKDNYYFG